MKGIEMVLITPCSDSQDLEYLIQDEFDLLIQELKSKENVTIDPEDIIYQLFNRIEYLGVRSSVLYPNEDLPDNFGVQRGYAGGGIHSGLIKTEIHRISTNRQAKADRILDIFKKYFWQILESVDQADGELIGEEKEDWDKCTI